jgi:hypothetical protein
MSEKTIPFVVTDRRKFRADGTPNPDADPSPAKTRADTPPAVPETAAPATEPAESAIHGTHTVLEMPRHEAPAGSAQDAVDPAGSAEEDESGGNGELPPAPTAEQMEQSRVAYEATAERLDIAVRSANPGAEHPPAMSFDQIIQSVYMQAIMQLGGGTPEGEQPRVDILGARQSIDMLTILHARTAGNVSRAEDTLLASALFELRLAFLEITQALARSSQQRAPGAPAPGSRPGPNLVR